MKTLISSLGPIRFKYIILILGFILPINISSQTAQKTRKIDLQKKSQSVLSKDKIFMADKQPGAAIDLKPANETVVNVQPNQTIFVKEESNVVRQIDPAVYEKLEYNTKNTMSLHDVKILPELFVKTGDTPAKDITYRIAFESNKPLKYEHETNKYSGTLNFFLVPETTLNPLPEIDPVFVSITSTEIDAIVPDDLEIKHLSIPLSEVSIEDDNPVDSAAVKIITKLNTDGYRTYLKVEPALILESQTKKVQGYGIQEAIVHVLLRGTTSSDPVNVNLSINKGHIEPSTLSVRANIPQKVTVRSAGLGTATLSAISTLRSNEIRLEYGFPWLFLTFTLIGGVLGGMVNYYLNKEKKKSLTKHLTLGIILGIIGAAAWYVFWINLLKVPSSYRAFNEGGALVISFLVALGGRKLFDIFFNK